ncbi:MAG TPA: tripartite tricarboxylate transporter substrate binding protein BugD, partial [Xanthobacteraceae bacterium]
MLGSALRLAYLAFCLTIVSAPAGAQDFPARVIKFVVPFAAGSATDTLARIL